MPANPEKSYSPKGLSVHLDRLLYQRVKAPAGGEPTHMFVYFITILNREADTFTLLRRKWVLENADGSIDVIEGDRIVGQTPVLKPGQKFSYNSFHATHQNCIARGAFHGHDSSGAAIHVPIPRFELTLPETIE